MKNKHVVVAVIVTYLVMSFVPSLGITSLLGKFGGSGSKGL